MSKLPAHIEAWILGIEANGVEETPEDLARKIELDIRDKEKDYWLVYTIIAGIEGRSAVYCTKEHVQRLKALKEVMGVKRLTKQELDAVRVLMPVVEL